MTQSDSTSRKNTKFYMTQLGSTFNMIATITYDETWISNIYSQKIYASINIPNISEYEVKEKVKLHEIKPAVAFFLTSMARNNFW
jgi:hypothetical protein